MTQVQNLTNLIDLCEQNKSEFFVMLRGGLRSSKNIYFDGQEFEIINEIDFSSQNMTAEELSASIIGKAMNAGALYCYE
jgi:hypothetical protein